MWHAQINGMDVAIVPWPLTTPFVPQGVPPTVIAANSYCPLEKFSVNVSGITTNLWLVTLGLPACCLLFGMTALMGPSSHRTAEPSAQNGSAKLAGIPLRVAACEDVQTAIAVSQGQLFIRSEQHLFCVGTTAKKAAD